MDLPVRSDLDDGMGTGPGLVRERELPDGDARPRPLDVGGLASPIEWEIASDYPTLLRCDWCNRPGRWLRTIDNSRDKMVVAALYFQTEVKCDAHKSTSAGYTEIPLPRTLREWSSSGRPPAGEESSDTGEGGVQSVEPGGPVEGPAGSGRTVGTVRPDAAAAAGVGAADDPSVRDAGRSGGGVRDPGGAPAGDGTSTGVPGEQQEQPRCSCVVASVRCDRSRDRGRQLCPDCAKRRISGGYCRIVTFRRGGSDDSVQHA